VVEEYTLCKLIGDIKGKSILDIASGEGHYSRKLKKLGAAKVLGVDISPNMVQAAINLERKEPLGIEYRVGDATKLEKLGEFDICFAAWLLLHSKTPADLICMCQSIFLNLKPGGILVSVNDNPDDKPPYYSFKKYGWEKINPKG